MIRSVIVFFLVVITFNSTIAQTTPCEQGMAGDYPCGNVSLVAHVNPQSLFSEILGGTWANDIWGWTDPDSGTEYVIIGLPNGTTFVDISDPEFPVVVGHLDSHEGRNSLWRDIKVYSNHAFIVNEASGHGMQVFDLTRLRDVTDAPEMFTEDAHYNGVSNAHNIVINEETGFAFAVGSTGSGCNGGGLHMINIQDPLNPTYAGCFDDDGYTHDAQCVIYNGPDTDYVGKEICFNSNEDAVTIVDVTDKNNPIQISTIGYGGSAYTHQGWLTEDHQYFLSNDELDEAQQGIQTRTLLWDFTDLDNPTLLGNYYGNSNAIDHNLYVHDGHVYMSNYNSGLRILNLDNIADASVFEVAFFDTHPENDNTQTEGTWSNYPYFESGVIAVSDINRGLFLLRATLDFYITRDIENMEVCEGSSVEIPVEVVGDNLTYNWQIFNGETFVDISSEDNATGFSSSTLTLDNISLELNEVPVRCIISDGTTEIFTSEAVLTVAPLPVGDIDVIADDLVVNVINRSFHAETFSWNFGDGSETVNQRAPSHTYSDFGEYTIQFVATNECGNDVIDYELSLRITSANDLMKPINLYPIPAAHKLNLDGFQQMGEINNISIFDTTGRLVSSTMSEKKSDNKVQINVSSLQAGVYHINIHFEEGIYKSRFVVE
ncbi:MAG: choice-of-anchor B family protein [bacterium]|nr:choice-of-anchor B family protein [bacterium]